MTTTRDKQITVQRIELPTPLPVGPVNAFLLTDGSSHVLVDCGTNHPTTRSALMNSLREFGLEIGDLDGLVLTHGHVDHVGLAGTFQRAGVPVFAPPFVDSWLTPGGYWYGYRNDFYVGLYTQMGMPRELALQAVSNISLLQELLEPASVDVELAYGTTLPILPQFEILHVPGHAQHACALYDRASKHLIAGDQLISRISSNALIEPTMDATSGVKAERTKSLLQYRSNLLELRDLELDRVYPGHGEEFGDVASLIEKRLLGQERRKAKFKELVQTVEDKTTFGIAVAFFSDHWDQLQLIFSETLGYLDWLAVEGEIEEEISSDGVHRWRLKSN